MSAPYLRLLCVNALAVSCAARVIDLNLMIRRVAQLGLLQTAFQRMIGLVVCLIVVWTAPVFSEDRLQSELASRTAWTTSRIHGSPDAPLPLAIEPAFAALRFTDPMHVRWQPDLGRYFVCELGGKIWSFPHKADVKAADLAADLKSSLQSFDAQRSRGCDQLLSMVFDPEFANNRFIYLCMVFSSKTGQPLPDGSRVSRFRITEEMPPRIDIDSELPIITWVGGGHNGGDMAFDSSGCLLISTGDATEPSPPDRLNTGQDISDLLASILRIDVREAAPDQPYRIPTDNPFTDLAQARGEVWAFGFRNPWRISVDHPTEDLWVGDVGWEKWELVHRVVRGGNYGWSVREGPELIQPNQQLGPTPIQATRVALSHADAASITGGFVYRGDRLSAIKDQYLFGDWITGRIWSLPLDESSSHREVASGPLRIIAFSPDRDGEPLVVNHFSDTTLFRLASRRDHATEVANARRFPRRLSQTGIFRDVATQAAAPGVREFRINQPQWQDGAIGRHFLALPDLARVTVFNQPQPVGSVAMFRSRLHYPAGTVLAKTLSLPTGGESTKTSREQKIETQLLHFDGRLWHAYSYVWNEAQTDAELAPAEGSELMLPGPQPQRWRVHSRTECMQCHNPWPETTLAFTPEQLHQPGAGSDSEWLALVRDGYVETLNAQRKGIDPQQCVQRALSSAASDPLDQRARSYLHANCAHCHQQGAGAAVPLSLKITDDSAAIKAIDIAPSKGDFGLESGRLIAAGDPLSSVLLFRMASSSTGRMPHIGSREVDFHGVTLISDWIISTAKVAESSTTTDEDMMATAHDILASFAEPSDGESTDSSPPTGRLRKAMQLVIDLARMQAAASGHPVGEGPATQMPLDRELLSQLAGLPDPRISSLFEAFIPELERQRKLGPDATYADIADLVGNPVAGEALFFDLTRSQCANCHRVGNRGGQIGPDLLKVGKKLSSAQLFEALIDPSRSIEPKYQSHTVLLSDGQVITGLLDEESKTSLTLINAQGTKVEIDLANIESRSLDTKSIMPSGLGNAMSGQQAADLLAYLASLQ